jgi:hypothetical protein
MSRLSGSTPAGAAEAGEAYGLDVEFAVAHIHDRAKEARLAGNTHDP